MQAPCKGVKMLLKPYGRVRLGKEGEIGLDVVVKTRKSYKKYRVPIHNTHFPFRDLLSE